MTTRRASISKKRHRETLPQGNRVRERRNENFHNIQFDCSKRKNFRKIFVKKFSKVKGKKSKLALNI